MRSFAAIILGALLVAALWSAGWVYASHEVGARADAWFASEARHGRAWTCPNRAIGGYPFAITVACSDPTYAGAALGQEVHASLASLTAETSILHPRTVALRLTAPFTYQTSDRQVDIGGRWTTLVVSLEDPPSIDRISVVGDGIALSGRFGQAGPQNATAQRLETRLDLALGSANPAIGFDIAIHGAPAPVLDALAGGSEPIDVQLVGTLDHAAVGDARTPEDAIERWRQSDGRIDLRQPSRLVRGTAFVTATGALGLDPSHRPQGRLAAQFVGLEPILKRYGISGNLAAAGSLLSSLFGGGSHQDAPTVPGGLALPIIFQNGRLAVGPIRTAIELPPLY